MKRKVKQVNAMDAGQPVAKPTRIEVDEDFEIVFGYVADGDFDKAREHFNTLDKEKRNSIRVAIMVLHRISL